MNAIPENILPKERIGQPKGINYKYYFNANY